MHTYIIKRLILTIPVLIGVSLLIFFMIRLIPGDPAEVIGGNLATPEMLDRIREDLGLDQGLHVQYYVFVSNLVKGDLGKSISHNRPVNTLLAERFPKTLELTLASMLVSIIIGITAGIISAARRFSIFDSTTMVIALAGVAIPSFWLGMMLQLVFSVQLGWLPSSGRGTLLHLVLPALTLGIGAAGLLARITRSSMLEVLRQDYITTARAKGLKERVVIAKHALKNALIPVVTVLGLQFGNLLGGAVIIENVFAWPGVGRLMVEAILSRDYPVVQGTALALAVGFVFINLFVDLIYAYLDPRIRYTTGKEGS